MSAADARTGRIADDLRATLAPLSIVLEDISVTPVGKRRLVKVLIDRDVTGFGDDATTPVEPLDLDAIGELTRVVSDRLDETDAMGEQPYVLEVSSVGVDRPLTQPRHFRRNVGRLLDVTTTGDRVTGRIVAADANGIRLDVRDGKASRTDELTYDAIVKAKVQVEFNHPAPAADGKDN